MISNEKREQAKKFMSALEYLSDEELKRFVEAVCSLAYINRLVKESNEEKGRQTA